MPNPDSTSSPAEPASLSVLARSRSARLRLDGSRLPGQVRLLVVPVVATPTRTGPRWTVGAGPAEVASLARHRGFGPLLDTALDDGLRVDLLLRLLEPGRSTRDDRAQSGQRVLLIERRGSCDLTGADLGWWRTFRRACGIAGHQPAGACVVCSDGIRMISGERPAAA